MALNLLRKEGTRACVESCDKDNGAAKKAAQRSGSVNGLGRRMHASKTCALCQSVTEGVACCAQKIVGCRQPEDVHREPHVESCRAVIGQPHEADLYQGQGSSVAGQEGATNYCRIWLSVFAEARRTI